METLVVDVDTRNGVLVTVYPWCEDCKLLEWFHPGGRCLYTSHKFKPQISGIGVSKNKGIFYVDCWTGTRILSKYIDPRVTSQDVDWPHSETIYWCHYLTEIGWKP